MKPETGEYQPRGRITSPRRSWYPRNAGGQAFTHPRVQPQRPVPRPGFSRPDRGLGRSRARTCSRTCSIEGVIISTRKLVYDAGSAEDAIKALMQAQHKAVMKDLKNGAFDDKIDQYLGGTPGLEPRGAKTAPTAAPRASGPALTPTVKHGARRDRRRYGRRRSPCRPSSRPPVVARAKSDDALTTPVEIGDRGREPSATIELPRKEHRAAPPKPRTKTADRGSKGSVRFNPPPPPPPDDRCRRRSATIARRSRPR